MRILACVALAAFTCLVTPTPAHSQVGADHFRSWDRHEGATRATQRRAKATKRTKQTRVARSTRKAKSIQARLSPAIAREPVLQALGAPVEAARQVVETAARILPHPPGCPRRLFCGCGASVEVFGRPVRHLFLAANWLKFPAARPAPGMVAARRGHVMVIRQYLGNNRALVYDANSGRGLTRLHVRSLAGFSIRNPRA